MDKSWDIQHDLRIVNMFMLMGMQSNFSGRNENI